MKTPREFCLTLIRILLSTPAALVMRDAETFKNLAVSVAYFLSAPVSNGDDDENDETTPDDVAALETAAGKPCAFWDAAEAAAADVCRRLENDVRALRFEDTADCVNFPTYAIGYLFNADPSGMEAEDIKNFDNWFNRITNNGELHVNFDSVNPGDDPYFSSCPAFGLPAECERVAVTYFPDL